MPVPVQAHDFVDVWLWELVHDVPRVRVEEVYGPQLSREGSGEGGVGVTPSHNHVNQRVPRRSHWRKGK